MTSRPYARERIEGLQAIAETAEKAQDRATLAALLAELGLRSRPKAKALAAYLEALPLAPPAPPPAEPKAREPKPKPRAKAPKASDTVVAAPRWWFAGCRKPALVKKRQAQWDASSSAFRAFMADQGGMFVVAAENWPDCSERDAHLREMREREARHLKWEAADAAWKLANPGWPNSNFRDTAMRHSPRGTYSGNLAHDAALNAKVTAFMDVARAEARRLMVESAGKDTALLKFKAWLEAGCPETQAEPLKVAA